MAFNDNLGDSFNNIPLFCNDESVYTIKHVFLVKSECRMRFDRQNILETLLDAYYRNIFEKQGCNI